MKEKSVFAREAEGLRGKRCLVVGLASTGISVARFLKRCGAVVTGTDSKALGALPGAAELMDSGAAPHHFSSFTFSSNTDIVNGKWCGAEMVIVSPGVPRSHPLLDVARKNGAEVISDIELACRFMDCPVVAIAGTNGKSTTTTLLGAILENAGKRVFTGGNLGTPAIECAEAVLDKGIGFDAVVWEISSFHLETTRRFNPRIGVLLNITEDHLDRYKDFADYAATKFRLLENQGPADYAVLNVNDPVIAGYLKKGLAGKGKVIKFSVEGVLTEGRGALQGRDAPQGLFLRGSDIVYMNAGAEEVYPTAGFKLSGLHNIENIMAAIASARVLGINKDVILKTLSEFKGLHHRMELVRRFGGVAFVDDSKGTNVGSLVMALRGMKTPVVLIAGGRDKGGDYGVLRDLVRDKVKAMILIGEARFRIQDCLGAFTETALADSMEDAVAKACLRAAKGDTVLLCPACSSFDMFKSYKERGDVFKALVGKLQ
ncbi:MAG: UDP-N-acetylmuramoyl-L-alanine--D-glutamate ligase [Deltaproteobacteria bacterium]|nr:UDP-N-acetylmuramoyl-L-alanine--D-glutamate ligase [Deltaproteobacteria bacterium]